MRLKWCLMPLVALALALGGCANPKKTQKAEAQQRWSAARAAVLASLAQGQMEAGNFDKSRQTIEEAERLDPENASLRILHAKLAIEEGKLDVADRQLIEARRLAPENAEADYLSGVVYQRWQKLSAAFDFYTAAAVKDTKELSYVMAQAEMLVMLGRHEEALRTLQERMTDFDNSAAIHDTIGQLLIARGDYELAVGALRQAILLAADDPDVREHLAEAYFYNQQFREAAEQIARLVKHKFNAERADLYVMLGECKMKLSQTREARDAFDMASQLNASSAAAWLGLSKAALELSDIRRAEASLRKAIALSPNDSAVQLMLGYLRLRQDRLNEALTAFQKASKLDPKDSVSMCMIGYVLEKNGKPDQAVAYYAKALQLKPDDELALRLMASIDAGE